MVSQRCQVAGKPRAVAERSLAEFDGCLLWRKIFRQSQILQNIHKKCQRLRKHGVFFFSPLDVFVKTPLVFCFAALFGSFFPPSLRHPHRTRWASGIPDVFGCVLELRSCNLKCPTMGSGCAQHRADYPYGSFISWQLGFWFEPFFPENEPAELVMTFPEFKRVPQNTFVRQNNSLHLFFLS